jgi:hypothetical protein
METKIPTVEQLSEMATARSEHGKNCVFVPYYDLSWYRLTVRCQCGWSYTLDSED